MAILLIRPALFNCMATRFVDHHQDFGVTSRNSDVFGGTAQSNLEMLKAFDDATIFSVIFPLTPGWKRDMDDSAVMKRKSYLDYYPDHNSLFRQIKFYQALERDGLVTIVREAADLDRKGLKFLMALEGCDTISGPEDIHFLRNNGVRSIGLTWNLDTKFAASCMSAKDYGLTGSGEELVRLCNDLNMVVDLGHASDGTIMDAAGISSSPVVVSHTNPKSLHNVHRNIGDDAIEAVVKNGGIVGLTSIPSTLGNEPTIDSLVQSMNYVGDSFGWDHVALGSDFLGISSTLDGFSSVDSIGDLAGRLGDHSDQVLWKNPMRVLRQVLKK